MKMTNTPSCTVLRNALSIRERLLLGPYSLENGIAKRISPDFLKARCAQWNFEELLGAAPRSIDMAEEEEVVRAVYPGSGFAQMPLRFRFPGSLLVP